MGVDCIIYTDIPCIIHKSDRTQGPTRLVISKSFEECEEAPMENDG